MVKTYPSLYFGYTGCVKHISLMRQAKIPEGYHIRLGIFGNLHRFILHSSEMIWHTRQEEGYNGKEDQHTPES